MQVRIARGEVFVDGLAKPVGGSRDGWTAGGSFELEQGDDEELRALNVNIGTTVKGKAQLVTYEATFVTPHGRGPVVGTGE